MAVVVGVQDRGDRHTFPKILLVVRRGHADECLGVRTHRLAQLRRQLRQAIGLPLHREQKRHRAHDAAGEYDPPRLDRLGCALGKGWSHRDAVAPAVEGMQPGHFAFGEYLGAAAFGQVQVVLVQRVFRPDVAARHAGAAERATVALRSGAAEVGIRRLLARLSEVDGDVGRVAEVFAAVFAGDVSQDSIARRLERVGRSAEHALRGLVMWRQFAFPVGEPRPGRCLEECIFRHRQRIGIDERPAADAHAVQHRNVPEE